MSKFKIGDYVVNKSDVKLSIIHIHNQDDLDFINSYGRYKNYRLALNIDYFRTLSAEEIAKWRRINPCEYCQNDICEDMCSNFECETFATKNWLNSPYDGWRAEEC